jgi:hypothetical protein
VTEQQKRTIIALLLGLAMECVTENVFSKLNDRLFKQGCGLPIGGSLSGFLASCYMQIWKEEFDEKAGPIMLAKLKKHNWYVDDGVGVFRGSPEEFQVLTNIANSVDGDVQFVAVHTSMANPKLVSLDVNLWIGFTGKIEHEFYRKPEVGDSVLPADSAHSRQIQGNYIQSEFLRIQDRCSRSSFAPGHLLKFKDRLLKGGYPLWFIKKHFHKGFLRWRGIKQQVERGERDKYRSREQRLQATGDEKKYGPPGDTTFWIPMISEDITKKLKAVTRNSNVQLQIRALTGRNMKQRLCKSDMSQPEAPGIVVQTVFPEQTNLREWRRKDMCYRVRCELCQGVYCGETQTTLQKRMYGHWRELLTENEDASALAEHFMTEHPGQPMQLNLIGTIKTTGYVDRKCTESVWQQLTENSINRRIEGNGTIGNLYLS